MKGKVITIFGTRPEAIKMIPVIMFLKRVGIKTVIVVTAQHRVMLDQVLKIFQLKPDYDLNIMLPDQSLSEISVRVIKKVDGILEKEKPSVVLVQGDTATAFTSALAAFYHRIPIGHIEAGLRTYDKYNPFPEEINRQLIDVLADFYFAPTEINKKNLISEGKDKSRIFITGNTAIDAILHIAKKNYRFKNKALKKVDFKNKRVIFMTCHRRESFGKKIESIFGGVKKIVDEFKDIEVIYPVHLNPNVQRPAKKILGKHPRVTLTQPIIYTDLVQAIRDCFLVITDSGGIQEEAPVFNKPVLVLRDETERTEGIKAGTLRLVGTSEDGVYQGIKNLLESKQLYQKMVQAKNPYGDGRAAERIVKILSRKVSGVKC